MASFPIGVQVIIRRSDTILLGRRAKAYGYDTWGLPGGHLELGESFEAAAAREVREETSLTLKATRIFTAVNDPSPPQSHHIQIGLIALDWSGEVANLEPHKCREWQFFSIHSLPAPLFSSSAPLIDIYLSGTYFDSFLDRQNQLGGSPHSSLDPSRFAHAHERSQIKERP